MGRGRDTSLTRRRATIQQRKSVVVVTNGKCTELQYFNALRKESWVTAKLVAMFQGGSPKSLIDHARIVWLRDDYDEAWVVCDVDDFDVTAAIEESSRHGIGLALSNPSFEVWLLLHLCEWRGHFSSADKALAQLKKTLKSYDKTQLSYADFRSGIKSAMERAKALGDPPAANPSSSVWRVICALGAP